MWQRTKALINEAKRVFIVIMVVVLLSGLIPFINSTSVSAAAITQRSLQLGSAITSTVTTYTYSFVPATTSAIQSLGFQACTTAIGTCTAPAGLSFSSAVFGSITGWTNATNFAVDAVGSNNCIAAANVLCAKRTQAANETNSGVRTISFTTITNPSGASCTTSNCTFFVRVSTYSDTAYTTLVDSGNVASSTTQTLTLNATVEEELTFCIGITTVDNATSAVPTCGTISGTSVSLGILNSSSVSVSPVAIATYSGNADNGLAEISSNAANGTSITYNAIQQAGTNQLGTLRVAGATCSTTASNTDQCINAVGVTKATLTAGTEDFGMTVAGINCSNVTAYTCNFSTGATNLTRTANYNCDGTNTYPTTDNNQVSGTTHCSYAWDQTGTAETIASSTSPVGNEALILKFAATPNLITPTGSYTALADYVATPTY